MEVVRAVVLKVMVATVYTNNATIYLNNPQVMVMHVAEGDVISIYGDGGRSRWGV